MCYLPMILFKETMFALPIHVCLLSANILSVCPVTSCPVPKHSNDMYDISSKDTMDFLHHTKNYCDEQLVYAK